MTSAQSPWRQTGNCSRADFRKAISRTWDGKGASHEADRALERYLAAYAEDPATAGARALNPHVRPEMWRVPGFTDAYMRAKKEIEDRILAGAGRSSVEGI